MGSTMARGMTWEWQEIRDGDGSGMGGWLDGTSAGRDDDDRSGDGEGVPQESGKRMNAVTVENSGTNF